MQAGESLSPGEESTVDAATGLHGNVSRSATTHSEFLLDRPAGRRELTRATVALVVFGLMFVALLPQARLQLVHVQAFIPIYESALVVIDLVTAVLLFGHFRILRSPATWVLACGYLFSAVITIGHGLTFPGAFAPDGLLGANGQSTAWIYAFWHGGFPLFVLAYAGLKSSQHRRVGRVTAFVGPVLACLLAVALVALATSGATALPVVMSGDRYAPALFGTVVTVWLISLLSLLALLWRRPYSVLDIWLMVVLSAWLMDIGLSSLLNGGRYDLGFYGGRIFGALATGAVLIELLIENSRLYAGLLRTHELERERSRELASARDAAQAAAQAKSVFLASMSHEIRTPMNAIIGLTQLVLETELQGRQRDYLGKVQHASKALLRLLNDILDYSKIEAGKVALEAEEFNPEETIENVGHLFSARIAESGLDLFFEIDDSIPQRLLGDALRLTQVLNNLVGNALKFTRQGEIVISAKLVSREAEQIEIRFSVRDTGIGLTQDQCARLFQAFEQADSAVSRKFGGTGLGLSICKSLVEMMGGHIWVASTPGLGSTFVFTAKFGVSDRVQERIDLHRIRGVRTLVVDAQPTARLLLQKMLQGWKFQVGTAAFADEVLLKMRRADREVPYELLLLDWKSAQADLIHQARAIQAERCSIPLKVLVMAAEETREAVLQDLGEMAGVEVVVKPLSPSRLFEAILALQHGDMVPAGHEGSSKGRISDALLPLRGTRVLLVDDNTVNQQVASTFLELGGLDVTLASNGLEALTRMQQAHFDIVLMDMQMPAMDGLEATRLIRAMPNGVRIPIVAMTAGTLEEDRQACFAAGMNAHVSKPIDPRQLARTLMDWVPARRDGSRTEVA